MGVVVVDEEWSDAARARTIPVRLYLPADAATRVPLVVLSHATGGAREWYEYLGRHWAAHGYVSLHLQHRGSDIDCWRGKGGGAIPAMRFAAADPQNAVDRAADMLFALDEVARANEDATSVLAGRIDYERIGACGHSLGAKTAMTVAGQIFLGPTGDEHTIDDARVKAVIAMSSPRPWSTTERDRARIYAKVAVPCLHFTGTRDDSPLADTTALERRIAYDQMSRSDQLLVTFEGGDHMVFAGAHRKFDGDARDPVFHDLVRRASLAFWDAYLKDDAASAEWLTGGGFAALLGAHGVFETKLVTR